MTVTVIVVWVLPSTNVITNDGRNDGCCGGDTETHTEAMHRSEILVEFDVQNDWWNNRYWNQTMTTGVITIWIRIRE